MIYRNNEIDQSNIIYLIMIYRNNEIDQSDKLCECLSVKYVSMYESV